MHRLFSPLGLTLLAILALLPGLWELPLMDRDEPRFAHATVEMKERGDWVVPYFNDEYRFDKPPLTYWWMRVNFEIFGINEFSARLHSVQCSWLIALLLFLFARKLGLDRKMAFLAGAGWLTALQVLIHSRMAVADMPLILFLVLTMFSLHQLMTKQGKPFWHYVLLTLWFALGFLAKGPLAYAIPEAALLAIFALLWWLGRKASPEEKEELVNQRAQVWIAQRAILYTLLPSFALVLIWALPAQLQTDWAYFDVGIGKHVVERGTGAMNDRFFIPGLYYLIVIIPFLLPWSPQLPATLKKSWRHSSLETRFLLGWLIAPFLVFSFYATQLPHYILPGYPAFFLLLAMTYREGIPLRRFGKIVRAIALALPALAGLLLVTIGLSQTTRGREALDLALLTFLLGGVLLSLAIMAASLLRKELFARIATVSAFLSFSVFFLLATGVARHAHLTLRLREATGIPAGTLQAAEFKEPSLTWYYDDFQDFKKTGFWERTDISELDPEKHALVIATKRRWRIDDESWLPLLTLKKEVPATTDNTAELIARFGRERVAEAKHVSGWSPATSSWIEVIVFQ